MYNVQGYVLDSLVQNRRVHTLLYAVRIEDPCLVDDVQNSSITLFLFWIVHLCRVTMRMTVCTWMGHEAAFSGPRPVVFQDHGSPIEDPIRMILGQVKASTLDAIYSCNTRHFFIERWRDSLFLVMGDDVGIIMMAWHVTRSLGDPSSEQEAVRWTIQEY